MHGGARSYLFDLGTGMYASGSLPWFEEIYARRGITFNEVFGAGDPRWFRCWIPDTTTHLMSVSAVVYQVGYGVHVALSLKTLPLMMTYTSVNCAAWEAKPADQAAYWAQVPDAVKLTLHYYNVPFSVEPESNPLRMIRTLYQPGDFVVVKACVPVDSSTRLGWCQLLIGGAWAG